MSFPKSSLVHKNKRFLIALLESICQSPKDFKTTIQHANPEEVNTLIEIIQNFLEGNHRFISNENYIKRMKRYKKIIRSLASTHLPVIEKRKAINQKGGGALVASLLIPIITSLVTSAMK